MTNFFGKNFPAANHPHFAAVPRGLSPRLSCISCSLWLKTAKGNIPKKHETEALKITLRFEQQV